MGERLINKDRMDVVEDESAELKADFLKHQKMYQLPGVSLDDVKSGFEDFYVPSVRAYYSTIIDGNHRKQDSGRPLCKIPYYEFYDENTIADNLLEQLRDSIAENDTEKQLDILLITVGEKIENTALRQKVLKTILSSSKESVVLIKAIEYSSSEIFPEKERLLIKLLEHQNSKVVIMILRYTQFMGDLTLREQMDRFLDDSRPDVRAEAIMGAFYFGDESRKEAIIKRQEDILEKKDASIAERLMLLKMKIFSLKNNEREKYNYYAKKYIQLSEEHNFNLYRYHDLDVLQPKEIMPKTGGRMETLAGSYSDKVLIRYVNSLSFNHWKIAYESPEIWRENGFDYIPVEPIYSFRFSRKYQYTIEARVAVLGMSVGEYFDLNLDIYNDTIKEQIQKIKDVLSDLDIDFARDASTHFHDANFCLVWEKLPGGNQIDWSKPPRVYLIDWDYAGEKENG